MFVRTTSKVSVFWSAPGAEGRHVQSFMTIFFTLCRNFLKGHISYYKMTCVWYVVLFHLKVKVLVHELVNTSPSYVRPFIHSLYVRLFIQNVYVHPFLCVQFVCEPFHAQIVCALSLHSLYVRPALYVICKPLLDTLSANS